MCTNVWWFPRWLTTNFWFSMSWDHTTVEMISCCWNSKWSRPCHAWCLCHASALSSAVGSAVWKHSPVDHYGKTKLKMKYSAHQTVLLLQWRFLGKTSMMILELNRCTCFKVTLCVTNCYTLIFGNLVAHLAGSGCQWLLTKPNFHQGPLLTLDQLLKIESSLFISHS